MGQYIREPGARMLPSKVLICGLLILLIQVYQFEAFCFPDVYGNVWCATGTKCSPGAHSTCVKAGGRPSISAGGNCAAGELNCGRFCIPASLGCDGNRDCANGADEPDGCSGFD